MKLDILNNRYKLIRRQGKGGMAVVYKAHDMMLERTVAIKVLRENISDNTAFRERFRQEAKAAANLSHPNIVTVHDFGLDQGVLFIVMEYVNGLDAKVWLKENKDVSIDKGLNLLIQACAGIGYAHRSGLVHCDIKPQNLIITPDNHLKVTDFGIARALASISPNEKSTVIWGSPQYVSPEIASGLPPSPASDVYSLGIVFYEFLTGRLPFASHSPSELIRCHREVIPPPPSVFVPDLPAEIDQLIMKVLAKQPSSRYRTADQFGRILITIRNRRRSSSSGKSNIRNIPQQVAQQAIHLPKDIGHTTSSNIRQSIDWGTILLGLTTLIALGGLIPFWLWVYLSITTPFH